MIKEREYRHQIIFKPLHHGLACSFLREHPKEQKPFFLGVPKIGRGLYIVEELEGLVPFYWLGLEPERGLRCQRKGCGAITHMALCGSSFLPVYPTIMKAWTPIVLLMSARSALTTFGRLWAFLIHGERNEDPSQLSGVMRYLLSLLFFRWAFLIPFISQLLH